jgi:diamine N-acetyltransferase
MQFDPERLEIRKAAASDAKLLSVLAATTFYEAYFEQDEPANLADYIVESFAVPSMRRQIDSADTAFYILYADGLAVGYAKLVNGSRDPAITVEKTIELKRIYMLERVWRKGFGEKLLSFCIDTAKEIGCDSLWLGVWEENERGLQFYKKHGFNKVGTVEFPYGNVVGVNHVMEMKLPARPSQLTPDL